MDLKEWCKDYGFESEEEFHRLICEVDISTVWKMANFKTWQFTDGTKDGLLKVIEQNKKKEFF